MNEINYTSAQFNKIADAVARVLGGEGGETAGASMDCDYGHDLLQEVLTELAEGHKSPRAETNAGALVYLQERMLDLAGEILDFYHSAANPETYTKDAMRQAIYTAQSSIYNLVRCVHCGDEVRQANGWWIHKSGLSRCQSSEVTYGHLAHPVGVPCPADGPNPCLGAKS